MMIYILHNNAKRACGRRPGPAPPGPCRSGKHKIAEANEQRQTIFMVKHKTRPGTKIAEASGPSSVGQKRPKKVHFCQARDQKYKKI